MGVWDTCACANRLESTTGRRQNKVNTRGYTQRWSRRRRECWMGRDLLKITNVTTSSEAGAHNLIKSGYLSDLLGDQKE
jgi:hypothetical protein